MTKTNVENCEQHPVPTSTQLVKDGAARFLDMAQELDLLHCFEMESERGNGDFLHMLDAQHLVSHADWCLREAASKVEQHYGGKVTYCESKARFVWQD